MLGAMRVLSLLMILWSCFPLAKAQNLTSIGLELDPFFIATSDFAGELHLQSDRLRAAVGYWNGIYPDYMSGDENFEIKINAALTTRLGYFFNEQKTLFADLILMGMDWTITHNQTQQKFDLANTQFTYGFAGGYRWQPFKHGKVLSGIHVSPTLFWMFGINPDAVALDGQTFSPRSFMFLITPRIGYQFQR